MFLKENPDSNKKKKEKKKERMKDIVNRNLTRMFSSESCLLDNARAMDLKNFSKVISLNKNLPDLSNDSTDTF